MQNKKLIPFEGLSLKHKKYFYKYLELLGLGIILGLSKYFFPMSIYVCLC